ncbi:MAG: Folylpolyglutamate synthase [Fimbriimonadales bacterium]|nr:Folylpolyglutamate synthase [Fimbriimonadales bacterium]
MDYPEAIAFVEGLGRRGWRLGLDRMTDLMATLGNPDQECRAVHIAGTNGKGSVAYMVQAILDEAGLVSGGFFSPFVFDYRERIQSSGIWISEEDFARIASEVRAAAESLEDSDEGGVSKFEFETAVGFQYWREKACDAVALEVGLGGRLDATNVVTPLVSVITEIGLDHAEHLGGTLEAIAGEKAGIIKAGVPVVCSATDPAAVNVIAEVAAREGCECWVQGVDFRVEGDVVTTPVGVVEGIRPSMRGAHQIRNAATAVAAIHAVRKEISDDAIRRGIACAVAPGRLQKVSENPEIWLDGAHNPQAAAAVAKELGPCHVVFSATQGHDCAATLSALKPAVSRLFLAEMRNERGRRADELGACALVAGLEPAFSGDPSSALAAAKESAGQGGRVLVTGSFYLLSEAWHSGRQSG